MSDLLPLDVVGEQTRDCVLCKVAYPVSHFKRPGAAPGAGGPFRRCVNCRVTEGSPRERVLQMGRDTARRRNLRRLYDITPEEYDALRAAQGYCCAICQRHEDDLTTKNSGRPRLDGKPSAEPMKLHVDHDHNTNEVRGLLCGTCNLGIANFDEQPDRMLRAINYVNAGGFHARTGSVQV